MKPDNARIILTSPLGNLEPDVAADLIVQLLTAARGLGLKVNEAIVPDLWVAALNERSFAELKTALMAYARRGNAWLNIPGELLAQLPDLPNADPDVRVWEAIEREVAAQRAKNPHLQTVSVAHLPEMTVRHFLALNECSGLVWSLCSNLHPLDRAALREKYLTACRRPRPEPIALLDAPALPYRNFLWTRTLTAALTQNGLPMIPSLFLPVDE